MDARLGAIREHIVALAAAVPDLPNQFERAVWCRSPEDDTSTAAVAQRALELAKPAAA